MSQVAVFTIVQYDGSTITLAAETAAAPFYGYHLIDYGPQLGALDLARNGSPYVDGGRIVNQRSENIVEQYRLDIVGTSPDDALAKLAALYRLVYWARDVQITPNVRTPPGITYAIPGTTRSGFAYILNGSVSETQQTPRLQVEGNRIKGIVLTLERTRWFLAGTGGGANAPNVIAHRTGAADVWGAMNIDGVGLGEVKGDTPARVEIKVGYVNTSATSIGRVVCGYLSDRRQRSGYTAPTMPPVGLPNVEVENGVMVGRTNFNIGAAASASGGQYGFSTAATGNLLTYIPDGISGKFRVFARALVTAGSAVATMKVMGVGGVPLVSTFAPVAITGASWRMWELGVISAPQVPGFFSNTLYSPNLYISVDFTSITNVVWVDNFVLIPCGEFYLDMKLSPALNAAGQIARYSNLVFPNAVGAYTTATSLGTNAVTQYAGEMFFPPGKGSFYWLVGDANFVNTIASAGGGINVDVNVAYQYDTAPAS